MFHNKDIGLKSEGDCAHLTFSIGTISDFFQTVGKMPVERQSFMISHIGKHKSSLQDLLTHDGKSDDDAALLVSICRSQDFTCPGYTSSLHAGTLLSSCSMFKSDGWPPICAK